MEERFILKKSQELPEWWVLHDTENSVIIKFKEHEFNETQQVTLSDPSERPERMAAVMAEIGDWLFSHAYSVAMPTPVFEFREIGDKLLLLRNTHPRFTLNIEDECDIKQLADALRAASEFIKKHNKQK